jgi:hypothetical protein
MAVKVEVVVVVVVVNARVNARVLNMCESTLHTAPCR